MGRENVISGHVACRKALLTALHVICRYLAGGRGQYGRVSSAKVIRIHLGYTAILHDFRSNAPPASFSRGPYPESGYRHRVCAIWYSMSREMVGCSMKPKIESAHLEG